MHQYGYIPLAAAGHLKQTYSLADPTTWVFERDEGGPAPVPYGGVEEVAFSPAQQAELLALGGGWFPSAAAFQAWLLAVTAT